MCLMVYALNVASTERTLLLYNQFRNKKKLLYCVSLANSTTGRLVRAAAIPHMCRDASKKPVKTEEAQSKSRNKDSGVSFGAGLSSRFAERLAAVLR